MLWPYIEHDGERGSVICTLARFCVRHRSSSVNMCSASSQNAEDKKQKKQKQETFAGIKRSSQWWGSVFADHGQECSPTAAYIPGACVFSGLGRFCLRRRLWLISRLCGKPTLKLVHAGIGRHGLCGVLYAHDLSLRSSERRILTRRGFALLH